MLKNISAARGEPALRKRHDVDNLDLKKKAGPKAVAKPKLSFGLLYVTRADFER